MKLYYKTLKSATHTLRYTMNESIWTLKPKVYKALDINILENYKFRYIGKVLGNGSFIGTDNNIHNTFSDGVSKYTCEKTIYCASSVDLEPLRSFRTNFVVL
jgi:hypothetical protein